MNAVKNIQAAVTVFAAVAVSFAFLAEAAPAGGARAANASGSDTNIVYIATNTNTNVVVVLKTAVAGKYRPLAEARAMIGEIISDPSKMVDVMQSLSPEDQKTFLADANAAIEKLPGSTEDKTAKYLNVNKAALMGASSGNMVDVLAVTYATVPPESLAMLSESYANDLFSRNADPSQKLSDAAFAETAKEVVSKVEQATAGSDDAGVRNALAIITFVKASDGSPADLTSQLVATMPDSTTRELAEKEWIPAAMAEGDQKSYESMLAYADAGKAPNLDVVLNLAGPQILDTMLVDITSGMVDSSGNQTMSALDQAVGGIADNMFPVLTDTTALDKQKAGDARPRTTDPTKPWNPAYTRSEVDKNTKRPIPEPEPEPEPEPPPYPYTGM